MGQDRLSDLALLSIEHVIHEAIDFSDLIRDFVNFKAGKERKAKFSMYCCILHVSFYNFLFYYFLMSVFSFFIILMK